MIKRDIEKHLIQVATYFPVIALLGPRQSGKTTLVQAVFPHYTYVSLEDLDVRARAIADPRLFLESYSTSAGIILDEIQHVPELLSYMQTMVDAQKKKGYFILTGSQNLLINQAINQTLAGRIGILNLLPLSIHELSKAKLLPQKIEEAVFNGCYPRIYSDTIPAEKFYKNYINTYIERDVRQIKNISDLNLFQKFVQLCAGRIGQPLNVTSLGNDCGIDHKTARAWISVLEATYIIRLLYPYYKNFGKHLIKSPKLFFVDTGIACTLLRIKSAQDLYDHYMRGSLIESYIISDLTKQYYNADEQPHMYFWKDSKAEIDCILEIDSKLTALEIKSAKTLSLSLFDQLRYWRTISDETENYLIYAGDENQSWPEAKALSWKSAGTLITKGPLES